MKKFELVLLVMLLIHSFSVMIEAKQHVKTKSDWVIQRTPVDPEWLKVYVDDESKRLCLNFKDSFAPITVEVKDIENNVTPESVEVTKKPATKSQTDEKNASVKVVGNFTL